MNYATLVQILSSVAKKSVMKPGVFQQACEDSSDIFTSAKRPVLLSISLNLERVADVHVVH